MQKKIFEGIKMIDFSQNYAGPMASSMMASFGAEVIKIERPVYGDDTRSYSPQIEGNGFSYYNNNKGKKSVTIDLTDPEGREILKSIIADMDVLLEAFKPGVMKKFGLDYENVIKINPNIIYCSVSAFGQTGKYAKKPGYDLIAQAMSGMMEMTGETDGPPMKSGLIIGDIVGTSNAFGAISAALYYRSQTGEGQNIDVSLVDGLFSGHSAMEIYQLTGEKLTRSGNHQSSALCPYGLFNGKDNQSMIICAPNNKLWTILCETIGKKELANHPDFATANDRLENIQKVIDLLEGWAKTFDNINDAVKILDDAKIPCCKVIKPYEMMDDEHFKSRGMLVDYEIPSKTPGKEPIKFITKGPWIKFSKTPGQVYSAQDLGESNYEILTRYGITKERIDELQTKWTDKVMAKNKK